LAQRVAVAAYAFDHEPPEPSEEFLDSRRNTSDRFVPGTLRERTDDEFEEFLEREFRDVWRSTVREARGHLQKFLEEVSMTKFRTVKARRFPEEMMPTEDDLRLLIIATRGTDPIQVADNVWTAQGREYRDMERRRFDIHGARWVIGKYPANSASIPRE
jgi:hypothetical protein